VFDKLGFLSNQETSRENDLNNLEIDGMISLNLLQNSFTLVDVDEDIFRTLGRDL